MRISRNRCFIPNKNGKCLWFLVGNQVPVPPSPGPTLPVTCHGKRLGVELFEKKEKSWIQERDRMHWQYACIICIHTWNPNDSNDSSFVSEKTVGWILKGKSFWSFRAQIRLAFTTYSRPMLLAIWYLSSAASSASSLGNTTWQKNTATSNQHLLCWKMGLLGIQVVSLHTPPTMKGIPCCRLLVKVASWRVPLGP